MARRWKKQEITYLKRYASRRRLEELAERFHTDTTSVREKLEELDLEAKDWGGPPLADEPDPMLAVLEKALAAMYKQKWEPAAKSLQRVIDEGEDVTLIARAREYLRACEQNLASTNSRIRDPYLRAVFERNAGNLDKALEISTHSSRARDDRFLYLAAAVSSLQGELDAAAKYLRKAIKKDPLHRIHALHDSDFVELRDSGEFDDLFAASEEEA
jgi:tetratricopeptide (TPR) repeat protein